MYRRTITLDFRNKDTYNEYASLVDTRLNAKFDFANIEHRSLILEYIHYSDDIDITEYEIIWEYMSEIGNVSITITRE